MLERAGSYYEFILYVDENDKWYYRVAGGVHMHGPFDSRLEAIEDAVGPMVAEAAR